MWIRAHHETLITMGQALSMCYVMWCLIRG
jgi:hypothetical protein